MARRARPSADSVAGAVPIGTLPPVSSIFPRVLMRSNRLSFAMYASKPMTGVTPAALHAA